jgi:hypothetical protein
MDAQDGSDESKGKGKGPAWVPAVDWLGWFRRPRPSAHPFEGRRWLRVPGEGWVRAEVYWDAVDPAGPRYWFRAFHRAAGGTVEVAGPCRSPDPWDDAHRHLTRVPCPSPSTPIRA